MIYVERHFEERRLSSTFSWKCSKWKEILKSVDFLKRGKGMELDSGPLLCPRHLAAVWEWLHLKPRWATSPAYAYSYLKAVYNPAFMIFKHILLINSLNLLMVCLYPFVLLSALSLCFNSSFPSPLLCPNLLICKNHRLFFSLQFCLAKKTKLLSRLL